MCSIFFALVDRIRTNIHIKFKFSRILCITYYCFSRKNVWVDLAYIYLGIGPIYIHLYHNTTSKTNSKRNFERIQFVTYEERQFSFPILWCCSNWISVNCIFMGNYSRLTYTSSPARTFFFSFFNKGEAPSNSCWHILKSAFSRQFSSLRHLLEIANCFPFFVE